MRRRRSRRYRWLPTVLTAGGLGLILLGGVAASPGRAPDEASTTNVGLIADNASATVVPSADFLRARAHAAALLDRAIERLRSNGAASSSAAADRLEAIARRLARATPGQPEELEAIVSDLNRELIRGLVGRTSGTILQVQSSTLRPMCDACDQARLAALTEVLGLLREIIETLRELIQSLFPMPPYAPPPYRPPHR